MEEIIISQILSNLKLISKFILELANVTGFLGLM